MITQKQFEHITKQLIEEMHELYEEGHTREIIEDIIRMNAVQNYTDEIYDAIEGTEWEFTEAVGQIVCDVMDTYDEYYDED